MTHFMPLVSAWKSYWQYLPYRQRAWGLQLTEYVLDI